MKNTGYAGLNDADALIIVPPFVGLERPSLAAHVLQACARQKGFQVQVFYANLAAAKEIGEETYYNAFWKTSDVVLGERVFARAAYGKPAFGECDFDPVQMCFKYRIGTGVNFQSIIKFEERLVSWIEELVPLVLQKDYKVVGCTSTFEQIASSVAFLNAVKSMHPEIITIMGGANCHGEMAEGMLSLSKNIDYTFSGESENSFPEFLNCVLAGQLPRGQVIDCEPCMNLDEIPLPDYSDYYCQLDYFLPESQVLKSYNVLLPYETSRGCWWGERKQCNFCGLNGQTIKFRQKSPNKVISELKTMLRSHPTRKVVMVDNVIPGNYFETLLPRIPQEIPDISVAYEVRSSLTFQQLLLLKEAGVVQVQPGIEALSTSLLTRMNKGVLVRQNVSFLRKAQSLGMTVHWNLIFALPGDTAEEYEETVRLMPLIGHLPPPRSLSPMSLDRFSPYFNNPDHFGITELRPFNMYKDILPPQVKVSKIASHFEADFESFSRGDSQLMRQLNKQVRRWCTTWMTGSIPKLELTKLSDKQFMLIDTRELKEGAGVQIIDRKKALVLLVDRPIKPQVTPDIEWALKHKLILELDSWYVSLVTASPDLILELTQEARQVGKKPMLSEKHTTG
jgi:ribosomal peptide maturation radical SAM protein 1